MNSRIRRWSDSALLMASLVVGGLVCHLAAKAAPPPPPVRHPVGCHACSVSAPPTVVAAFDAELVRIGAVEAAETDEFQ